MGTYWNPSFWGLRTPRKTAMVGEIQRIGQHLPDGRISSLLACSRPRIFPQNPSDKQSWPQRNSQWTLEVTHFADIPPHNVMHTPFLFIITPYEVFICAVDFGIKRDFHMDPIVASGNATLDLVAFLPTDDSTTEPVSCKAPVENDLNTYRATADHLFFFFLHQYRVELAKRFENLRVWRLHDLDAVGSSL